MSSVTHRADYSTYFLISFLILIMEMLPVFFPQSSTAVEVKNRVRAHIRQFITQMDGLCMRNASEKDAKNTFYCSFCGKSQHEARKIISANEKSRICICDECVDLCSAIVHEEKKDGTKEAPKTNQVFISYRRSDSIDMTGRLYDKLALKLGKDSVFKDIDSIPLGEDFREHIQEGLKNCQIFLLVIGKNWRGEKFADNRYRIDDAHDFVRIEVETALVRSIPVIPILVHDAEVPSPETLPESMRGIAYRQSIRVRPDPDFHRDVDRIVRFLKSKLAEA